MFFRDSRTGKLIMIRFVLKIHFLCFNFVKILNEVLVAKFLISFPLQLWCRLMQLVLHYFLLSNYSWMLCEGLYLHTVLVSAFISETRLLRCMLLLGWGMPGLTIAIYGPVRHFAGNAAETSV